MIRKTRRCALAAALLLLSHASPAQTRCGIEHTNPGTFICYPNPVVNAADANVAEIFHLSAQANAPAGHLIKRYTALVDGRRVFDNQLATALQRLSIEVNVKSPFSSGSHKLTLVVNGADSAEVAGLEFHAAADVSFCDPFNRVEARSCLSSSIRQPLQWPEAETGSTGSKPDGKEASKPTSLLADYSAYVDRYTRNLKALEADIADAVSVDSHGSLYIALHSSSDIELRKYAPDGSLSYDNLVHSCGIGFLSIAALALDDHGRAWIAGNGTACIPTTANSLEPHLVDPAQTHGFVVLIDTTKPSSAAPLYSTYLSREENRITGLRVNSAGSAYVTGATESIRFPHESLFTLGGSPERHMKSSIGFVSVLNPSGSALQWSTLFEGARLDALAIDSGGVYITGGSEPRKPGTGSDDVFVAALSDSGRRLSYLATIGSSGLGEGRAISRKTAGNWVFVTGESNGGSLRKISGRSKVQTDAAVPFADAAVPFAMALQPCATGIIDWQLLTSAALIRAPAIAFQPALDAFAAAVPDSFGRLKTSDNGVRSLVSIQSASNCPSANP